MSALDMVPRELRGEARGAIPNGQRIVKVMMEDGDANSVGTGGVVLASQAMKPEALADLAASLGRVPAPYMYFVEWDTYPGLAVCVAGDKIARFE